MTKNLVSKIMIESRKPGIFMAKATIKEASRKARYQAVVEVARKLERQGSGFTKAQLVVDAVKQSHGIDVSLSYVCSVLRHDLGVTYRCFKRIPFLGNSPRCLMLR